VKGKPDIIDIIEKKRTTVVWPRQKDARGEKKKRTSKKNVDGRSTSSHDNKKFRTDQWRNREEWRLVSGSRRQLLLNRIDT
jgi:hypothetical protein